MKKEFLLVSLLASLSAAASVAEPQVTSVTSTVGASGNVTVNFTLDCPAIVTVDFVDADGRSIGLGNCTSLVGDVNRYLAGGDHSFVWNARADLANAKTALPPGIRTKLTAWSPEEPPPYLVADLYRKGEYGYYASSDAIPGGIGNVIYKTRKLVLRKIPAANVTWRMGCANDSDVKDARTYGQRVRLTKNYYIGVYQVTLSQICQARGLRSQGSNKYSFSNVTDWERLPAEAWSFNEIRGQVVTTDVWPIADANLPDNSLIRKLRDVTGLQLDLPTEAQWEYACHAGVDGPYYSGGDAASMKAYAWSATNWADDPECVAEGNSNRVHSVGLKLPNKFGLYDMCGNTSEFAQDLVCKNIRELTQYKPEGEDVLVDPLGATKDQVLTSWSISSGADDKRCVRNWASPSLWTMAYDHNYLNAYWRSGSSSGNYNQGFRVACPAAYPAASN